VSVVVSLGKCDDEAEEAQRLVKSWEGGDSHNEQKHLAERSVCPIQYPEYLDTLHSTWLDYYLGRETCKKPWSCRER